MKLSELLEQLDPSARIKIGAADGSSYFYIGNPADFMLHYWYYSSVVKSAARRSVDLAEKDFILAKNERFIPESVKNKLKRAKDRLDNLVFLKDREVVKYFDCDSAIEEDVTAILVEGYETGRFWCFEDSIACPAICC